MKPAVSTTLRASESTDRTPTLVARATQPKPSAARPGAARRILNALMRSLASPHV